MSHVVEINALYTKTNFNEINAALSLTLLGAAENHIHESFLENLQRVLTHRFCAIFNKSLLFMIDIACCVDGTQRIQQQHYIQTSNGSSEKTSKPVIPSQGYLYRRGSCICCCRELHGEIVTYKGKENIFKPNYSKCQHLQHNQIP